MQHILAHPPEVGRRTAPALAAPAAALPAPHKGTHVACCVPAMPTHFCISHSCLLLCALQGGLDLRPGLVQFGAWWLERVAYPEFQDTGRLWLFGACFATLACALCSAGTTQQGPAQSSRGTADE